MTKSINSKYIFATLAVAFILGATCLVPASASANYDYSYDYSYYYNNPYGSPIMDRPAYGQTTSNPTYIQRQTYVTPVVVQQPVYVQQPVIVQQPVYYQVYPTLTVTCTPNSNYSNNNGITGVNWIADANGGNGYYSYSWTGTDGLYGSGKSTYYSYYSSGTKYASVTVYSNGQSITQNCTPININPTYYSTYGTYQQPVVYQQPTLRVAYNTTSNSNNLDIGCYVDPTNAKINQPVSWSAEVTGGIAPYTYSWTGSDGLNGTQSSLLKYYFTTGSKSAVVTVTSADGRTGVKACSNAVVISNTVTAKAPAKIVAKTATTQTVSQASDTSNSLPTTATPTNVNANLSAASLFSLNNVPWGWVAILIILVLFFTVAYLLFNRKKI